MGTRADFYVGRGPESEWLGSIAFDGYRVAEMKEENIKENFDYRACWAIKNAATKEDFQKAVADLLALNDDGHNTRSGMAVAVGRLSHD